MTARPAATDPRLHARLETSLPRLLPDFLPRQRWFGGKARTIAGVDLEDCAWLPAGGPPSALAIVVVRYADASRERYGMVLGILDDPGAFPALGRLAAEGDDGPYWIVEATGCAEAAVSLLGGFVSAGELPTVRGAALRYADIATGKEALGKDALDAYSIRLLGAEQSNTSIRIGRSHVFKLFRRLEQGENPEAEITRFLTGRTSFRALPGLRGSLTYVPASGPPSTLGVLQDWVENDGDGWSYTVSSLRAIPRGGAIDALARDIRQLGGITGDFHAALASDPATAAFAPDPVTTPDLATWRSSLAASAERLCGVLAERLASLPATASPLAKSLLGRNGRLAAIATTPDLDTGPGFAKIRVHGDFHLGQTLKTAAGFVLFDFEGEPARPLAQRRAKHCALKDVAGMLRSLDYAVETARGIGSDRTYASAAEHADRSRAPGPGRTPAGQQGAASPPDSAPALRAAFLEGYLDRSRGAVFLPSDEQALTAWLDFFELDKALYEVEYEINNRPDWVTIPLEGMRRILERRAG